MTPSCDHLGAPQLELAVVVDEPAAVGWPAGMLSSAGPLAKEQAGAAIWHRHLEGWLVQLRPELPARLRADAYSLGITLTTDAVIAGLNGRWRHREGPTDVLAFAAQEDAVPLPHDGTPGAEEEGMAGEPLELGDIVISLETAARQAEEAGHGLEHELLFLASHGLLHLLGWDHPDEARLSAMLERQERLLAEP